MLQMKSSRRNCLNFSCSTTLTSLPTELYCDQCSVVNMQLISITQRWCLIFTQKTHSLQKVISWYESSGTKQGFILNVGSNTLGFIITSKYTIFSSAVLCWNSLPMNLISLWEVRESREVKDTWNRRGKYTRKIKKEIKKKSQVFTNNFKEKC